MATLGKNGMDQGSLYDLLNDIKNMLNDVKTYLIADGVFSAAGLTVGSTPANVATNQVIYQISKKWYIKAAVAAGTALSGDNVPQATYGAWGLDIGSDGTIDISAATANATGYASAALAVAGLADPAASHIRLGYVTASKSDGVFDPGTTSLSDAAVTEAYTDATTLLNTLTYTTDIAFTGLTPS